MRTYSKVILPILLLHAAAALVCAAPMGTAINYQGYLADNKKPATGLYDFKFKLYDAVTGGSLVGSPNTINRSAVPVTNGLLSVILDFGSTAFQGDARWLQIEVAPNGSLSFTVLPRVELNPTPYSLFATTATTAKGVSANAVSAAGIASGQVVKSVNNLFDNVTLAAGANVSLAQNGNTLTISSSGGGGSGWSLTGNSGTTAGVNFLGTSDNQPLELKVNNIRALRLEPGGWAANTDFYGLNTIGGHSVNRVFNSAVGATIAGGGAGTSFFGDAPNLVGADFGAIGGGAFNTVAGAYGTIPGGYGNSANGYGSFAAGQNAHANHDGSFVWGDGTQGVTSPGPNSFVVLAQGGVTFYTAGSPVRWGNNSSLGPDQGGSIELGNSLASGNVPYIDFHFGLGSDQDYNVRLINDADGRLTCAGNLNVDGSTTTKTLTILGGADVAEPFKMSARDLPKGSVVVIDDANPGHLKLSELAYDTRVAGIISGANGVNPGISLSQQGVMEGDQNVALSGRVYVQADAENGAIKPGDLLTTSSTPGHAMKVTDHARAQGAILGKAMSGLKEGNGMVLVLVTLQ